MNSFFLDVWQDFFLHERVTDFFTREMGLERREDRMYLIYFIALDFLVEKLFYFFRGDCLFICQCSRSTIRNREVGIEMN